MLKATKKPLPGWVQEAHDHDWGVGIHVMGDVAVRKATEAIYGAYKANPGDRRHQLIHCYYPDAEVLKMMAEAGIIFVPAHLAEECGIDAEKTHVRDIFGFQRLHEGKYTAAQIDSAWELCMWEDFAEWFPNAPEADEYRHLDFSKELADARAGIIPGRPVVQGEGETTRW